MNVLSSIDTTDLPVTELDRDELWYKDAIIYQLHVKAFFDSNNDGIGDFRRTDARSSTICRISASPRSGCCRSIPRRCATTATTSPTTARSIPIYGTLEDFKQFIQEARIARPARHHRAGHQSHLRPARLVSSAPAAARPARRGAISMSGATATRNTKTRASSLPTPRRRTGPGIPWPGQYYWHRFFSHQPDLNFDNPARRQRA